MVLAASSRAFILHWGEMGTRWGVNRSVAQVHALLYLSPEPMTAEEIAETLSLARSNVSNSVKELQNWKLVFAVPRMDDRRDFFHTSHDVWALFTTVVEQRVRREIEPTLEMLERCAIEAKAESLKDTGKREVISSEIAARITSMRDFMTEMYGWYRQMSALPHTTLRGLIHVGTGITRLIPSKRRN